MVVFTYANKLDLRLEAILRKWMWRNIVGTR